MRALMLLLALAVCGTAVRAEPSSCVAFPQVSTAPTIDGVIRAGEWDRAAVTCGFRDNTTGLPARAPVTASACYDAQALYCLFQCRGEEPAKLVGGPAERDSSIWTGSEVEVFIAPADWPASRYAHFMVNHAGDVADEMYDSGDGSLSWNPDWQHATGKAGEGWIAEMAIPWRALDVRAPQDGATFRLNFARNATSIAELSSWAEVLGGFHHPGEFGEMVLGADGPTVAIAELPGRAIGPATILARLSENGRSAELRVGVKPSGHGQTGIAEQRFAQEGDPGPTVTAALDVPGGTEALAVTVEAGGRVIWEQGVRLDLPDPQGSIAEVRERLDRVRADLGDAAPTEVADIGAKLTALEGQSKGPITVEQLPALTADIQAVGRRVGDLAALARAKPIGPDGKLLPYYVTHPVSTLKIQPDAADPGPPAETLRIAMARNEYEPVQIAVCAVEGDLAGVRVSAGKLTGPGGAVIPRERVVVTPLGFVTCAISTGGAALNGRVPDVLLPNRPMDVPAGGRQPFFITVQSTDADPPGEYRGTIRVTPRNAPAMRLPLVVRVYNVTLPAKSRLRTAFVLWDHMLRRFSADPDPDALNAYIRYSKVMLAHRISPITMWAPRGKDDGSWDLSRVDRYLSAMVPLGVTTFNIGGDGDVARARNTEYARTIAAHLKERGWWNLQYLYGYDEASPDALKDLQASYSALVEAVPDIKIMQTGWSPQQGLKGLVRIWCPLTASADMEVVRQAQKEGDEVWWYVCCGPTAPYANLFVDYPGVDHRILGWQTFQKGIEGFLYWGVDQWPGNDLALDAYDRANYANWNPNSYSAFNGDGYLLYPGKGDTALPSMRLALLRDGFEDYELFTEVRALAGDGPGAARVGRLLSFDELIPSLTEFTQDGSKLLDRREEVLQAGEELVNRQR